MFRRFFKRVFSNRTYPPTIRGFVDLLKRRCFDSRALNRPLRFCAFTSRNSPRIVDTRLTVNAYKLTNLARPQTYETPFPHALILLNQNFFSKGLRLWGVDVFSRNRSRKTTRLNRRRKATRESCLRCRRRTELSLRTTRQKSSSFGTQGFSSKTRRRKKRSNFRFL